MMMALVSIRRKCLLSARCVQFLHFTRDIFFSTTHNDITYFISPQGPRAITAAEVIVKLTLYTYRTFVELCYYGLIAKRHHRYENPQRKFKHFLYI